MSSSIRIMVKLYFRPIKPNSQITITPKAGQGNTENTNLL